MADQEQDAVMHLDGSTVESEVVVPGDAARYKEQRQVLGELPLNPVTGNDPAQGDAVMREVEELQEEVHEKMENEMKDDLFGDDDDGDEDEDKMQDDNIQEEAAPGSAAAPAGRTSAEPADGDNDLTEAELERRRRLEYEEGDEDPAAAVESQKVQYAAVRLPKLPMASEKQKLWHAKLPNFLHLESRPFHPSTWDAKAERESTNVPVENTLRWRWLPQTQSQSEDNKPTSSLPQQQPGHKKQSNARIIRWNDGSMSLQLGSEIFDIATDRTVSTNKAVQPNPLPPATASAEASTSTSTSPFPPMPAPLPASSVASKNPIISSAHSDSTTYLVAQHPYAGLLESQAIVTGNLTFRPTAIHSSSHRKLASALSGKHVKTSKTVMMMASNDPEAEKLAREQAAGSKKGTRKAKGANGENAGSARKAKRKNVRSTRLDDFSDGDFDDDDDTGGGGGGADATRAAERESRQAREKAEMDDFLASESDDDEEGDEDDDEDEDGGERKKSSSNSRNGRSRREEEMDIEDDLDEMEARAEKAAKAEKKKNKQQKGQQQQLKSAEVPRPSAPVVQRDIDSDDLDNDEPEEPVGKKRLVVESDEE